MAKLYTVILQHRSGHVIESTCYAYEHIGDARVAARDLISEHIGDDGVATSHIVDNAESREYIEAFDDLGALGCATILCHANGVKAPRFTGVETVSKTRAIYLLG